jgi:hypothetical protein
LARLAEARAAKANERARANEKVFFMDGIIAKSGNLYLGLG